VKFREPKLVDYEPEEDENEVMELTSHSNQGSVKDEESSEESFITEECIGAQIQEQADIEEVVELEKSPRTASIDLDYVAEIELGNDEFHDEIDDHEDPKLTKDSNNLVRKKTKVEAWCEPEEHQSTTQNGPESSSESQRKQTKFCCEYKESDEYKQKLPKYNGFISKYGLSKEEITRRELFNSQMLQKKQLQQERKFENSIARKQINEEAFSKW
jgi:hypothetical protein